MAPSPKEEPVIELANCNSAARPPWNKGTIVGQRTPLQAEGDLDHSRSFCHRKLKGAFNLSARQRIAGSHDWIPLNGQVIQQMVGYLSSAMWIDRVRLAPMSQINEAHASPLFAAYLDRAAVGSVNHAIGQGVTYAYRRA